VVFATAVLVLCLVSAANASFVAAIYSGNRKENLIRILNYRLVYDLNV
jgi:hypothetical protein